VSEEDLASELRGLLREGRADEAAARVLAGAADERAWVRERSLSALGRVAEVKALLPRLGDALRDGADAGRRNAARAALAALSREHGPLAPLRHLERLVRYDGDGDVRLLAASALGESGNPAARPALEAALADRDANVSAAAADALGNLRDPRSVDALAEVVRTGDPWRALAALFALGRIGAVRALPVMGEAAADTILAAAAAEAIGELGDPAGLEHLQAATRSDDEELRRAALDAAALLLPASPSPVPEWLREAAAREVPWLAARFRAGQEADARAATLLGASGTREAAGVLADAMGDPGRGPAAAGALGLLPPEVALDVLLPRAENAEAGGREELIAALPDLPDRAAAMRVARFLSDPDPEVRGAAAEALGRARPEAGTRPLLEEMLHDPLGRAGAVLALGRVPGGACDLLIPLLADPDADIRRAAAEGIARCPGPDARAAVAAALGLEHEPAVQRALAAALGAAGGAEAVPPLAELARRGDPGVRFAAVRALGRTGAGDALTVLLEVLAAADPATEAAALAALGDLGDTRGASAVAERLDGSNGEVRHVAAISLRRLAPPAATGRLVQALQDRDWRIRLAAVRTLERIDAPEAVPALREVRERDADPLVRRAARQALGET
jgi:HEAT repeat protein